MRTHGPCHRHKSTKIGINSCENANKVGPTHFLQIASPCFPASPKFWNGASGRESDVVCKWFGGIAQLRTLEGTLVLALLALKQNLL